jgi:hypothetical protein
MQGVGELQEMFVLQGLFLLKGSVEQGELQGFLCLK